MKNIAVFFRFSAYLFMAFSLLLIGCASKLPPKTTKVEHYPMCYKPIQDLRDTEFLVAKYTAEGALLGALGGGLGCALSDIQGGNNPDAKKAATCAAVGAAAGAFAGYFVGKSEEKTTVERLTQHVKDVDDYKGKLDRRAASARNAQQCYSNSFDTAVANYKAKKISKETFEKQYVEISSGVAEANSLLEYDMAAGRKMQEDYQKVMTAEAQQLRGRADNSATVKKETRAKVNQPEFKQLNQMADRDESLNRTLDSMEKDTALYNRRLDTMAKTKDEIMV